MKNTQGMTLWFTGLPCSGKTTVADEVAKVLKEKHMAVERLDGDIIRNSPISQGLGFSKEDRRKNLQRVSFIAKLLSRNNVLVLATFVSPYESIREEIKEMIGEDRFALVYVRCPVEVCIERDVKGMYKKALNGEITGFTGVDDPFEEPATPDLVIDTGQESIEESVQKVMNFLKERGYVA